MCGGVGRCIDTGFWWGGLREGDHLGDPDVDGRIILRWIFRKWDVGVWIGSSWLRIVMGGTHLCVNEPSDSIKCEEFIDSLKTGYLLKNNSAPCSNSLPTASSDKHNTKQGNFSCQAGGYRRPCSSLLR